MSRGKAIRENVELAFDIYCDQGGNKERTLVELEKRGLSLTKKTLYRWIKRYRFEERRLEVDAERQRLQDSQMSFEEKMLKALTDQKEKYETYFTSSAEPGKPPDTQAMHAYTNLVKTIHEIRTRTGVFKASLFLEFMRDLIDWLSRNDPKAVPAIEKNFDDFISHAKEKYAVGS